MKKLLFITILFFGFNTTFLSQKTFLQSGPMVGYSEMREVQLWVQTNASAIVHIEYWEQNIENPDTFSTNTVLTEKANAYTAKLLADEVLPDKFYHYRLVINGKIIDFDYQLKFQAQPLWQWRTDPPNFKFALGSCTYINEPRFDRPGNGYGSDYKIFEALADKSPDMMLWLGDNIYLREADWNTRTGILHRYTHTRSTPEMQRLLATTHNYATWDDHDFGPNNSDRSFIHKDKTLEAFELFWSNPTFGLPDLEGGITTQFLFHDIEFFLLDNRYFRSPINPKGSDEVILGKEQIDWLIDGLSNSFAPFKIIAIGGQVLNSEAVAETYANFEEEQAYLLKRIEEENIKGVIFVTGDRHNTELNRVETESGFIMYDLTVSSLTAGSNTRADKENNKNRVAGTVIMEHNFAIVEVTGKRKERVLNVTVYDKDGKELWARKIDSAEFWKK
ncbi:MAG: alkaline phosphatase family protein [Saprospiraceae bacterium]|nr:alkaline phosphatase family protein [Saprospiraceae bacterium]